jgi:hypothetical protein
MPEEKFKLPWSSYDELIKIIRAYGQVSQAVSLKEISDLSGTNPTIISSNAGFLTAIGILESGAKKIPTPQGRELSQALEHNMSEQIMNHWRRITSGNDFFEKLLTAIKIRNGMDEETLKSHIAYSAGQPRKQRVMTGTRTVIDILFAAGLITEADGKITSSVEAIKVVPNHLREERKRELETSVKETRPLIKEARPSLDVRVNFQVNINCNPAELEELAEKLRTLLKEFSLSNENDDKSA